MEEPNNIHSFYIVKVPPSPIKVQREMFKKQYQLLTHDRITIHEELAHQKGDEHQIKKKLMWFGCLDEQIEWNMSSIKNLERWNQAKLRLLLPDDSVPKTPLRPDRKRCHKRLMKKGKMDIEYLQQVQEEHFSLKKSSGMTSCGTQQLNDMIVNMVQRIQHGNKKRVDEMKIYQQMSNFEETKEIIIAREPEPQIHQRYTRELKSKRDIDWKRSLQHEINIRLNNIENIKRKQIGRIGRVTRLKAELEHVRKNISCLNKKLESVNTKRAEAYKRGYELEDQNNKMNSSGNEYESFKTCVKELATKGDVVKLKYVCDIQVEGFMRKWNENKAFREHYEKRKLVWKEYSDL